MKTIFERLSFYVLALLLVIAAFPVSSYADELYNVREESDNKVITEAISFIETTLSDFATDKEYEDDLIDCDSVAFKQFLQDKRRIADIKQELGGHWKLFSATPVGFSYRVINNDIYEVTGKVKYEFSVGDREDISYIVVGYKLHMLFDGEKFKVLSAMDNGLSSGTLYPRNIVMEEKDFDLLVFDKLTYKQSNLDYDFDKLERNLINYYSQMSNAELKNERIEDENGFLTEGLAVTDSISERSITWHFFSDSEKSNMTTYQDNWYDDFNPNYADFSDWGGDCTNYASQILRAGNSAFNENYGNGIYGDTYWYYRDSSNRSTSWTAAQNLKNFLLRTNNTLGPKARVVNRFQDLDVGSIVFLEDGGEAYHSVIVHTAGGDPTVTAHTYSYRGFYSVRYGGISHTKVEVRGYYH